MSNQLVKGNDTAELLLSERCRLNGIMLVQE
jgi:hypothetical protein